MHINHINLAILLALLLASLLTGCGTSSSVRPAKVDPEVSRAAQLYQSAQYSQAATLYRQLADQSTGERQQLMLLMSADSWLSDQQYGEVDATLALLDPALVTGDLALRYRLIQARMQLEENQPDTVLSLLQNPPPADSLSDLRQRYYHYKAEAYLQKRDIVNRTLQLIQLEQLTFSTDQRLYVQMEILAELVRVDDSTLQQSLTPTDMVTTGWLELSRLARSYRRDPQAIIGPYKEWRSLYPEHPALPELLSNYYAQQQQQQLTINQVAVLLPESGPYSNAAKAIRDGILAAWYATDSLPRPQLRFYDTGDLNQVWPQVNAAAEQGADIILGPLDKKAVLQLARAGNLPVPVLALNQVLADTIMPRDLYQYSLSPEDEARQVADWAWNKGLAYPGILFPDTALGHRLLDAFNKRWEMLSGEPTSSAPYPNDGTDLSGPIVQLLDIQQVSKNDNSDETRPKQMADVDFVFAIGNPSQIRQIRPMLQYNYAGKLPVFTTSRGWTGSVSREASFDVKGIELPDIPWLVERNTGPLSRSTLAEQFPSSNSSYVRLYPMGMDAFNILPHLRKLENSRTGSYPGHTGMLYMDQNQHILRLLTWISLDQSPLVLGVSSLDNTVQPLQIDQPQQ